jgi:hypothetical protein
VHRSGASRYFRRCAHALAHGLAWTSLCLAAAPLPRAHGDQLTLLPAVQIESDGSYFRFVQDAPQVEPVQPPSDPGITLSPREPSSDLLALLPDRFDSIIESSSSPAPSTSQTGSESLVSRYANDAGELLHNSNSVQSVEVQRRSPVSLDPRIRGYHVGQIYMEADGAMWVPARQDLDTIVSKLDPSTIENVLVVPGPYGVGMGPAHSFLNVTTTATPRYEGGFQAHGRTGLNFRANGNQWYGRQSFYGGNDRLGFRIGYGNRNGVDYSSGNGTDIPSSYLNQDFVGNFGYDINPYQHLEFGYNRLDQGVTEIPLQFFDINYLGTDGFNLRWTDEHPAGPWSKLLVQGWNNRTRFDGDTQEKSNPSYEVMPRVERVVESDLGVPAGSVNLLGMTAGNVQSTGGRLATTFGEIEDVQLTIGGDFRYLQQSIAEQYITSSGIPAVQAVIDANNLANFGTNLPTSFYRDPGTFGEISLPMSSFWRMSLGTRLDWLSTSVRASDVRTDTSLLPTTQLTQSDTLYGFYLTNDLQLDADWALRAGFGYAQRPPTLTERYSDGLFLAILQSGFTRVIGDPSVSKERNWQLDVSLTADYDSLRGRMTFFNAWIIDYITMFDDNVPDLTGARLVQFVNTDLATLIGCEMAIEYDLSPNVTPFATLAYVDGRDRQINAPLPGIAPMDTRLGLRFHDPQSSGRYGFETGARIVDNQDRLGTIRLAGNIPTVVELPTPGFTTFYLRAYAQARGGFNLVGGVDNLFNKNYLEHLDLRLAAQPLGGFGPLQVLSPGITPYVGIERVY